MQIKKFLIEVAYLKKKTDFSSRITEVEGCGLATNVALTAVENKITNVSGLVKKKTIT